MKKNYTARVKALKARRQFEGNSIALESIFKSESGNQTLNESLNAYEVEEYEKRGKTSALQYALGAMQEVDPKYTQISMDEASRVSKQIVNGLANKNKDVEPELQGSLPINVHLRRVSDVDILILPTWYWSYASSGPAASSYNPSSQDKQSVAIALRKDCVDVLESAYPAATVDDTGSKCITVTGGSLRREVDVVPAIWFDTVNYQKTRLKQDRAVQVFDKKNYQFNDNKPFLVQANIHSKDKLTQGGCKKTIRLLKTLKIDADDAIDFSSFNIMSIIHNMDNNLLIHNKIFEGSLIISLRDWMNYLGSNLSVLRELNAVDGSRKIIQKSQDEIAFQNLRAEVNFLVDEIKVELAPTAAIRSDSILKDAILF
ncbi:hypothetical protein [Acidovorax sp. Root402]|uniref:hypothetical protein n=1 Tax=Acidovorax sp. Root402 TaxID=1736527 RepID=UPI000AB41E10|nr:hypothetical protein [Acidovorax sp. Root402]